MCVYLPDVEPVVVDVAVVVAAAAGAPVVAALEPVDVAAAVAGGIQREQDSGDELRSDDGLRGDDDGDGRDGSGRCRPCRADQLMLLLRRKRTQQQQQPR